MWNRHESIIYESISTNLFLASFLYTSHQSVLPHYENTFQTVPLQRRLSFHRCFLSKTISQVISQSRGKPSMKFAHLPTIYCQMLHSPQPRLPFPLITVEDMPKRSSSVPRTPALTFLGVFMQSTDDSPLCTFPRVYLCLTFSSFVRLKHKPPTKDHFLRTLHPSSVTCCSFLLSFNKNLSSLCTCS